ncbi:MAG: hypothetical protein PHU08_05560 [Dehalococcoidales bacterium]|nr:hypothetical protein [Dehalococcoidales bacterium]
MKLIIKKIYCRNCQRLVKAKEQTTNGNTSVTCPRCNQSLWVRSGLNWKYAGKSA